MSAEPDVQACSEAELRSRVAWLVRKRWADFGITTAWAAALVGVTYWRQGADLLSHILAAFMVVVFASAAVVIAIQTRRELLAAGASDEAMRTYVRTQLDRRLNGFRTMRTFRSVMKVVGLVLVAIGLGIVVKERLLGNGWAGVPTLATTILWSWLFFVWPTLEERRTLPRIQRMRAELGA